MNFPEVIGNLALGIGSGIYSSIIVSVVFFVLGEYQKELNTAKEVICPIYGIITLLISDEEKTPEIISSAIIYLDKANFSFSKYEPWRFHYELHEALCSIYELLSDGKVRSEVRNGNFNEVAKDFIKQVTIIEKCDERFARGFIVRVFKNKIIISMLLVFLAVLIIA